MIDPIKISKEIIDAGNEWADAEAAAELLEETKRTVIAQLKTHFDGSEAAKESQALATNEYSEHVSKMVTARREANKKKVRWDSLKIYADLIRTKAATERAEMGLR